MKVRLTVGPLTRTLEASRQGERWTVSDEEGSAHELRLLHRDGPRLTVLIDGQRVRLWGVASRRQRQVWVRGRTWRYTLAGDRAGHEGPEPGALSSAIPAVVTEVLVRPGQAVQRGDKLVLLESMKMVLTVQAPDDGVVKAVRCQAGQSVEAGVPLVELEVS